MSTTANIDDAAGAGAGEDRPRMRALLLTDFDWRALAELAESRGFYFGKTPNRSEAARWLVLTAAKPPRPAPPWPGRQRTFNLKMTDAEWAALARLAQGMTGVEGKATGRGEALRRLIRRAPFGGPGRRVG